MRRSNQHLHAKEAFLDEDKHPFGQRCPREQHGLSDEVHRHVVLQQAEQHGIVHAAAWMKRLLRVPGKVIRHLMVLVLLKRHTAFEAGCAEKRCGPMGVARSLARAGTQEGISPQ